MHGGPFHEEVIASSFARRAFTGCFGKQELMVEELLNFLYLFFSLLLLLLLFLCDERRF